MLYYSISLVQTLLLLLLLLLLNYLLSSLCLFLSFSHQIGLGLSARCLPACLMVLPTTQCPEHNTRYTIEPATSSIPSARLL